MLDPVSIGAALAAVQSAVKLVKQASQTVNDVTSLGPVLGKYFDAKHNAVKVVEKAKKEGGFSGSPLGKALELEMALEQAREFEAQVQMLFFQANKMDVWAKIKARQADMEREQLHAGKRAREAAARKKKEFDDAVTAVLLVVVVLVVCVTVGWFVIETMQHCDRIGGCGR